MYVVGKFIFIYNDTNKKLTDLLFLYPKIEVATKVKRCPPHQHIQELIMDIAYFGPVTFFFANEPDVTYTFTFGNSDVNEYVLETQKDVYNLYIRVIEKDGRRILEKDEKRDYYQD